MGVHAYDLLRYLFDAEVVEVTVVVDVEPGWQVDTVALALLRFDNGALAYVNANQAVSDPQRDLAVYGTEGRVLARDVTRPNLQGTLSVLGRSGAHEHRVDSSGGFTATVAGFADAVRDGLDPSPSGADALRSVQLVEAMTRSVRERRTVPVDV